MKTRILKKLRYSNAYVSEQTLCDELGISITDIRKYINQLKTDGYDIEAVKNKGYKIIKYPDIVTKAELESQLEEGLAVKSVLYSEELDSTNNEAKRAAKAGAEDGTLYITECQTGGKGRRGRSWISPRGSGIWLSLLLRPKNLSPSNASMITLVSAMAVKEALCAAAEQAGCELDCRIKWPNDLVVNKKKVCGILTEMSAGPDCIDFVVLGIGINVNTKDFTDEIKDIATSLYLETGKHLKRSLIIAEFAKAFTKYYENFLQVGDLSKLMKEYNAMLINNGNQVRINEIGQSYTGTALGINKRGELLIKKEDGSEAAVSSGEVSVRGLYGYV